MSPRAFEFGFRERRSSVCKLGCQYRSTRNKGPNRVNRFSDISVFCWVAPPHGAIANPPWYGPAALCGDTPPTLGGQRAPRRAAAAPQQALGAPQRAAGAPQRAGEGSGSDRGSAAHARGSAVAWTSDAIDGLGSLEIRLRSSGGGSSGGLTTRLGQRASSVGRRRLGGLLAAACAAL